MAIKREDVEAIRERTKKARAAQDKLAFVQTIQDKAKPYESLVNDPSWNPYVNELTKWKHAAQEKANLLAGQLTDPSKFLTTDQVVALRMNIAALLSEADAYDKSIGHVKAVLTERDEMESAMNREAMSQHG